MSKTLMVVIVVALVAILFVGSLIGYVISASNSEKTLRNTITAKQKDNQNEFDAMWKTIAQVAEVTQGQKDALVEIFNGYASARSGSVKGGSLANWIHEAVPNVDTSTFNNLQNIITSKRDGFVRRQKELLDLKREHDNIIDLFPSSLVMSFFGRQKIDVVIVTSSKTENSFKTGKDDDVNVFKKPVSAEKN